MGRNHTRIYSELENVEFSAVADASAELTRKIANQYRVRAYTDYREMLSHENLQAVSVAVPTRLHREVAEAALNAGVAVLVEKPIAATIEDARAMIAMAQKNKLLLMVGHVERWNPAVVALKSRLQSGALGKIFQIHAQRLGPFPARVRDVGVVLDLATHDLDVMRFLTESNATRVYAETARRIHTDHEDLLSGIVAFASGTVGVLDINWLTPTKVRVLSVTGERGMFAVNYLTQELWFYRNDMYSSDEWDSLRTLRGVSEGDMIKIRIDTREPLKVELQAFLACVEQNAPAPVNGEDGLYALQLAQALVESGQTHQVIEIK
ncbi:MAG: Gfo/Idh/MocA family oxidoreductase [Chloroflexi bacterium]|nr:Gfo/Idh/MocA family oxidoreductase [Chloroflexota bacterium]